jgi:hypothetical protein
MAELKDRMKLLIDQYWGGSVNRAAGDLGVKQPTLHRIVKGLTPNPRYKILEQIVSRLPPGTTTVDWLASGRGNAPPKVDRYGKPISASSIQFNRAVARLDLDEATLTSVIMLPYAPLLFAVLAEADVSCREPDDVLLDADDTHLGYSHAAWDATFAAWAEFLDEAIDRHGATAVRSMLQRRLQVVAMGFSMFGVVYDQATKGQGDVRAKYSEWFVPAVTPPVTGTDEAIRRTDKAAARGETRSAKKATKRRP